jgi:ankyrin repeat protein
MLETATHRAAATGNLPALLAALDKHPSEAFARDEEEGRMPQHLAAKGGHTACLQVLLDSVADIEAADRYGSTALHYAAGCDREACLQALLKAGANIEAADSAGATPLHVAICQHSVACVPALLEAGARIEATDGGGATALLMSASHGWEECLRMLWQALLAQTSTLPTSRTRRP